MVLLVTANLGRHVDTAEFLRNVRAIDDEAGSGAVIGFQEIDEDDTPDEHHGLREVLDGFRFAGWETREPIALGSRWSVRHEEVSKGAPGLKDGSVGLSPARTITECLAFHPSSGAQVVFLDLHYPRDDPRLEERWKQVRTRHRERIAHWYGHGFTVVWFSDVNRGKFDRLNPEERTLAHRGLDWIRCIEHPDGVQIEVDETGSIPLTIDGHDAQWARVALHHPKEKKR